MRKVEKLILSVVLLWGVLAGYFAFNDLNISNAIVNEHSNWAGFFQRYGELPGLLVIMFGILIFSIQFKSASVIKSTGIQSILLLALASILLYISFIILYNSSDTFFRYLPLLSGVYLVLSISVIAFLRKINLNFSPLTIIISKIILGMALFGYLLSNNIIKIFWGRVRYRDLDLLQSDFTEWYIVNGINGHQSFPSGHAAMGWMLIPLFLIVIKKNLFLKTFTIGLIIVFALSIAASRVLIGAHYASDVLFGSLIMVITFLTLYKRYLIKDEKNGHSLNLFSNSLNTS